VVRSWAWRTVIILLVCSSMVGGVPLNADDNGDSPVSSRVVRYGARDIVPLYGQLRFTTLIVLPVEERILDFVCGDKDFWIVNGNQNLAYIKPAKSGARTNLNLITASGNVYSFVLTEVSEMHGRSPDLKVYLELAEPSIIATAEGGQAFVSARQLDDYRAQLDLAKEEARAATEEARATIALFRSSYPLKLRFPYRFAANGKPFFVTAMYHDDRFTFIQARNGEPPTLYEIKDGKPSLVDYDYRDGVFIVSKILDRGYLAIGERRLPFARVE
jgi:type IV secretory pathway VirB9-like protein